jgi:multidrug efflux pump subunit AcrB
MEHERLGISGSIARKFLRSEITPLLALVGILMGIFAVLVTPREEEPQIDVTFANVFIPYPGATAVEVENVVSTPAEQLLSEISGVEHVYSVSRPGMSILTVQFLVGEERTQSIVNLYNQVYSKIGSGQDWLPQNLGVGQPIIKPKGIDDVPIVSLTLWSENEQQGSFELQQVAHTLEAELKRVKGTRDIYTIGGPDQVVHLLLDPQRMAGFNISFDDLRASLIAANATREAGTLVTNNSEIEVQAGAFLTTPEQVAQLIVGMHKGKPVHLHEVATVRRGPDQPEQFVWFGTGPAAAQKEVKGEFPAVTIAIAKQPGTNAATIADQVIERIEQLRGTFIPDGVNVTVTRNYGQTATDKAMTLIKKLIFATSAVVLLVFFALGRREAFIVGSAVVITLTITLFASWAWGFTLNRVSLFALIFSIGILVDDAIVVVENIHRHMQMGKSNLLEAIPVAVDEVGGPTILATFTVIAALLPMAFVSGLMGPYMSPIPINASMGMFISLAVAFVVTPWLVYAVFKKHHAEHHAGDEAAAGEGESGVRLYRFFHRVMDPLLQGDGGRKQRWLLFGGVMGLILMAVSLAAFKLVIMKMLPFDNKSEFQIVVDMPEGSSVEQTNHLLQELAVHIATVPEVTDYQIYAGTAAPINFNGLVRQYYLRSGANVGDIQVNLADKHQRDRKSHEIASSVRAKLQEIGRLHGANVKVVEVPPGPPVQSPLVAEIYGLDYDGQINVAKQVRNIFEKTNEVVDVDDSVEHRAQRLIMQVDRQRAAHLGIAQETVVATLAAALGGEDASYLHGTTSKHPLPLRIELPVANKADVQQLLDLKVRGSKGLVRLSEIVTIEQSSRDYAIYHKDLLPVVFVTADVAGDTDSPLYGMFDIYGQLNKTPINGELVQQTLLSQPENPYLYSLKWDGEWQVTYETFRDMGIAYGVGMILIYLLVVAQFRSYLVPLIIMAPIPLTIIGVMPGHALLGANFTATSMIGMIALAGIIVRNSILLVDFINQQIAEGIAFEEAVIRSAAVRAKPIVLTGLAAMIGALFILDDPIFNGLAISLIFGIFVSTLLTLVVIPVMYYAFMRKRMA